MSLPTCSSASSSMVRLCAWVSEHQAAVSDRAGQTSVGCDLLSQYSHLYSCFQPWSLAGATEDVGGGSLWKDHAHSSVSLWKDRWLSLRSPELCLVLHVPVMLAGPGYKEHKAWPGESQHVFFSVWVVDCRIGKLSYCYRLQCRGASDDGCKTLCLEKRI